MGQIVVTTLVTLDGVMEAPGGEPGHRHTGWAAEFMGAEEVACKEQEVLQASSMLLGRITYESFFEGWSGQSGTFADRMNAMPKHVLSTTLRDPQWSNAEVFEGELAAVVADLKRQRQGQGAILVPGSCMLVHALARQGLVDEYRMMVFPVLVGSGRRLFPETEQKTVLHLQGMRSFASGVVEQTWQPT